MRGFRVGHELEGAAVLLVDGSDKLLARFGIAVVVVVLAGREQLDGRTREPRQEVPGERKGRELGWRFAPGPRRLMMWPNRLISISTAK